MSIWEYNWSQFALIVDEYRQPDTNEVSEPMEFIAQMSDKQQMKKGEPKQKFSLPTVDELMEDH
jgi:hypothetical protein